MNYRVILLNHKTENDFSFCLFLKRITFSLILILKKRITMINYFLKKRIKLARHAVTICLQRIYSNYTL